MACRGAVHRCIRCLGRGVSGADLPGAGQRVRGSGVALGGRHRHARARGSRRRLGDCRTGAGQRGRQHSRRDEGHIGLASLVVAVEATGGAMDFAERPGGGTLVTVTIPDELNQG